MLEKQNDNLVAIIGIGIRAPTNIKTPDELWINLLHGFDGVTSVPKERWSKNFNDLSIVSNHKGGFIPMSEWKQFDPLFFNISPKEASMLDPQERMVLKLVWESLEDAGINAASVRGSKTSVFIGASNFDYFRMQANRKSSPLDPVPNALTLGGCTTCTLSNRVSFVYDFRSSSITFDTACSTSLTAVSMGCSSILNDGCEMAICGGVNAILDPEASSFFSELGILSPDGQCRSFSADGNGFVRSEGGGIVILKKLSHAERDNNRIYAVIKGSNINNDGSNNKDFMSTPSVPSQVSNIQQALINSGLNPNDIDYCECHGTGTAVGDPIEVSSLSSVFTNSHSPYSPLRIGSIKGNVGHMESAAGVTSLIKTCLMLKNRIFVPNIHFNVPNPKILFNEWNIKVQDKIEEFPNKIVNIGINSFGIGGSNCHILLSEYSKINYNNNIINIVNTNNIDKDMKYLIPISSNSEKSFNKYLNLIINNNNIQNQINFKEFVLHQCESKSNLSYRRIVYAKDWVEFNQQNQKITSILSPEINKYLKGYKVVMLFCGQGSQTISMGMDLYYSQPIYKEWVELLDFELSKYYGYSILEMASSLQSDSDIVHHPIVAQPLLFIFQISMFKLYSHWGVEPSIVIGHSFGEISAAYVSGSITLELAIKIVYLRSVLQNSTIGSGKMLVVALGEKEYNQRFASDFLNLEIACYNSPSSIVLTGLESDLLKLRELLKNNNINNTFIKTPCSFHSSHQEPLKDQVFKALADEPHSKPSIKWILTNGQDEIDTVSNFVYKNLREPVKFLHSLESVSRLQQKENSEFVFLEIAPHPTLNSLVVETLPNVKIITALNRNKDENSTFFQSLGSLYCLGVNINFTTQFSKSEIFDTNWRDTTSILPRYQWDDEICWNETSVSENYRLIGPSIGVLGTRNYMNGIECYNTTIDINRKPFEYLKDHKVSGKPMLPGSAHLDAIIQAFRIKLNQLDDKGELNLLKIDEIDFKRPLFLIEGERQHIQTLIEQESKNNFKVQFYQKNGDTNQSSENWNHLAVSRVSLNKSTSISTMDIKSIESLCDIPIKDDFYQRANKLGLSYGSSFRNIESISISSTERVSFAKILLSLNNGKPNYLLNPSLIDDCFHGFWSLFDIYFPLIIKGIKGFSVNLDILKKLENNPPDYLFLYSKLTSDPSSKTEITGTCSLITSLGQVLIHVDNFILKSTEKIKKNEIKFPKDELIYQNLQLKDSILPSLCQFINIEKINLLSFINKSFEIMLKENQNQYGVFKILDFGNDNKITDSIILILDNLLSNSKLSIYYGRCSTKNNNTLKLKSQLKVYSTEFDLEKEINGSQASTFDLILFNNSNNVLKFLNPNGWLVKYKDDNDDYKNNHLIENSILINDDIIFIQKSNINNLSLKYKLLTINNNNNDRSTILITSNNNINLSLFKEYYSNILILNENEIEKSKLMILKSNQVFFLPALEKLNYNNYIQVFNNLLSLIKLVGISNSELFVTVITKEVYFNSTNYLASSFSGLIRTSVNEFPSMKLTYFDIDNCLNDEILSKINFFSRSFEILGDREFFIKNNRVYIERLLNINPSEYIDQCVAYEKDLNNISCHSSLDLSFEFKSRENKLKPGTIEIKVMAVGINFKDYVMYRQFLPSEGVPNGDPNNPPYGFECSGIIVNVANDVFDFKVGDSVVGITQHALSSHVIENKDFFIHKPENISHTSAAAIPIAFSTAYIGLLNYGRFDSKNDSVLIHNAAGGVGLAALNILKWKLNGNVNNINQKIFTTVGSNDKRNYILENYSDLISNGTIYNSNYKSFSNEIKKLGGVDIILNSLSTEYMASNFNCLNNFGRFIDLSLNHIYDKEPINASLLDGDKLYMAMYLDTLKKKPTFLKSTLLTIFDAVSKDQLNNIPISVFSCDKVKDSLNFIKERKHIGKIVIDFSNIESNTINKFKISNEWKFLPKLNYQLPLSDSIANKSNKISGSSCLITGQTGMALELTKWISKNSNISDIIIFSYSSLKWQMEKEIKRNQINNLPKITFVQCDIGNYEQVFDKLNSIKLTLPVIETVFHLATVYDDVSIPKMNLSNIKNVFHAKVEGAINLHNYFIENDIILKNFVLFSSGTTIFGHSEQGTYTSANTILEGLSRYRKSIGLQSLSILWSGYLTEGHLANSKALQEHFISKGILHLSNDLFYGGLEATICNQKHTCQAVLPFNIPLLKKSFKLITKVEHFCFMDESFSSSSKSNGNDISILDLIKYKISELLAISPSKLNIDIKLKDFGMDSLLTVQTKSWIDSQFNTPNLFTLNEISSSSINNLALKINSNNNNNNNINNTINIKSSFSKLIIDFKIENNQNRINRNYRMVNNILHHIDHSKLITNNNNNNNNFTPINNSHNNKPIITHKNQERVLNSIYSNLMILGIGTVSPGNPLDQNELAIAKAKLLNLEPNLVQEIYSGLNIKSRYLHNNPIDENTYKVFSGNFVESENKVLLDYSIQVCKKAIQEWGGSIKNITHIITVTNSAPLVADISIEIIEKLGLDKRVVKSSAHLMGCLGALSALESAVSITAHNNKARVLILCGELMSHSLKNDSSSDQLTISGLYGDGFSSIIVGRNPNPNEKPIFEVIDSLCSTIREPGANLKVTKEGVTINISENVPFIVCKEISNLVNDIIEKNKNITNESCPSSFEFLMHPTEFKSLKMIEYSLKIKSINNNHSWDIYENYGNMGSGSIFFVFDHARKSFGKTLPQYSIATTYGPGLGFHIFLLKNHC